MAQIKLIKLSGGDFIQHDTAGDDVTFNTITSTQTTGTAPFTVASTTVVSNLNADLLDGNEASVFLQDITGENIGDLSDVTITSLGTDELLFTQDGATWINQTIAEAGIAANTGTDNATFQLANGASGPLLKNSSGEVHIRNAADNAFANLQAEDITVNGNLTVSGTTTTVNTETVTLNDNIIVLNNNEAGTPTADGGIEVERGTSTNVQVIWNETTDRWQAGVSGSLQNVILADSTDLDSRYYTETEIGTTSGTTGSDLVGDDNSYSNFTPAATTVKGALSGIDTALGSLGGNAPVVNLTAGAGGWSQYDAIYISANDTGLPADADGISTSRVVGIAQTAVSAASSGDVQIAGEIAGAGSGWTAGSPVYLSVTAGGLSQTVPSGSGDVIIEVGTAINATDLLINIKEPKILA